MIDCPHGDRCSGCTQLGVPYAEQLAFKHRRLALALAPHPELGAVSARPTAPADPITGYRTRVKWMAGPDGSLGLFARGEDHAVVDIPACRVVSPALALVGQALRELRASPGWLRERLRAVDLREVQTPQGSRVLVTLVVEAARGLPAPVREATQAARLLAARRPEVIGVALNVTAPGAPQVLGPTTIVVHGVERADDELGDGAVEATFGSFVQAHRGVAVRMRAELAAAAEGPVLELYGGSGSTGLTIARRGFAVTSVESYAPASAAAGERAAREGLAFTAVAGEAASVAADERPGAFDLVVVNPPRRGLEPEVRRAIGRLGPRAVAYMSCDPATLARDLAHLARLGYVARGELGPNDMIPLTDEVETLAVLVRGAAPAPVVLGERAGLVAVAKAGHESVRALTARVRRMAGYEGATALHDPGDEVSGPVVFALAGGEAQLAAARVAVAAGESRWVVLARGATPRGGTVRRPAGRGREGSVKFRKRDRWLGHSLLELQVTRHEPRRLGALFRELGHPLVGDAQDAATARFFFDRHGLDRLFLHGEGLRFVPPGETEVWAIEVPGPADLPLPASPRLG